MRERDIVERLRDQGTRFGYVPGQLPHDEYSAIGQDMHEAAREIERLHSAPGQTEASVPTRTPEQGLSYHDGTEALREALDAGWNVLIGNIGEHGYRALFYRGSLFEAGPKVDATHRDLQQAVTTAARRALSQHVGGEG